MSTKFRATGINLRTPILVPPIDLIRARAAALTPDPSGEIPVLLQLFHPEFPETGIMEVSAQKSPAVVRACSRLRLEFRARDLAAFTDAQLEDESLYTEEAMKDPALYAYALLATIELLVLKNSGYFRPHNSGKLNAWFDRLLDGYDAFRAARQARAQAAAVQALAPGLRWQVVVHNDPVNHRDYVTAALQAELGLREIAARQRMLEVHHAKHAVVWQGAQAPAEVRAQALRAWHLIATAEPVPGS